MDTKPTVKKPNPIIKPINASPRAAAVAQMIDRLPQGAYNIDFRKFGESWDIRFQDRWTGHVTRRTVHKGPR